MTAVTGLGVGRSVRKNDVADADTGGGPTATLAGRHARRERLPARVDVLDDAGGRRAHDQRPVLDHARQVALRGAHRDPSQVGDVGRGHRDVGLEQHLQNQLFELVEVHGRVFYRLAHRRSPKPDRKRATLRRRPGIKTPPLFMPPSPRAHHSRRPRHMAVISARPPGTFCWPELSTTDVDAAKRFYGETPGVAGERPPGGARLPLRDDAGGWTRRGGGLLATRRRARAQDAGPLVLVRRR